MAAETIVLIDGNSLLHRAYHALPPLTTSDGRPTNAVYGMAQMLLALLQERKPAAALVAWDAPGPTFRHQRYADYKADRAEAPDDLVPQFGLARELVEALGLASAELPGYEADDIIGAMALRAQQAGYEVLIVTGDRDLLQMVGDRVTVLATLKGIRDVRIYDVAAVEAEYGLRPEQLVDLKALAGDSSDSIPGVPGVGPKTAQKLLSEHRSLEAALQHAGELKSEKLRRALQEYAEQARMSQELARIATDAPVTTSPDDCRWEGYRLGQLRALVAGLEFTSLLERLPREQALLGGEDAQAVSPAEVCQLAREAGAACLGVVPLQGGQVGIALAPPDGSIAAWERLGARRPAGGLFEDDQPAATEAPAAEVAALLSEAAVAKWGVDLKAAATVLSQAGFRFAGYGFDAAVASYLLAPNRKSYDLEALLAGYLGEHAPAGSATGEPEQARSYALACATRIPRLRERLLEQMGQSGALWLFEQVEMPLVGILRDMEACGIAVDRERLEQLGDQLDALLAHLARRIYRIAGHEFNLGSPQQLATVLFDKLKLPKGRKTKTGWSTAAELLEELAVEHEIARLVLEHREYAKLRSTYVQGLLSQISPQTGRVHTTFEQTVTATGRLSSRNPNLQNIPVRTEWGRKIRACFVAPREGWALLSADYSQIELRILAHMSQDPVLVEAFEAGRDVHASTAAALFDTPLDEVNSDQRRIAKTVNYAVLYGMGPNALSGQLGISREQAADFIASYQQRFASVKGFMDRLIAQGRENGFVETICGRRRPMPDLHSQNPGTRAYAERAAGNAPLQGSAADIMKIAMTQIARSPHAVFQQARMLLQVHDELVFEAPLETTPELARIVKGIMERAWNLSVPLVADVKAGPNWRDMTAVQ